MRRWRLLVQFLVAIILMVLIIPTAVQASTAPEVTASGASPTFTAGGPSVAVDPGISVTGTDPFTGASVAINSGFQTGDVLEYTTTGPVSGSYNSSTGVLTLSGSGTAADYQAAFRNVTYRNTNAVPPGGGRSVVFNLAAGTLYSPATGHFYEFVTHVGVTWTNAKALAESRSLYGMSGYLVTITSAAEQAFVSSKLLGSGWLGASDAEQEGTWKWVTGPEAGTVISYQFKTGWCTANTAPGVNGQYVNWAPGEPNDCGTGEDYAHFYPDGRWNDFPDNAGNNINGYVVEYGGMPGDPTPVLTASVTVNVVSNTPPTISDVADQSTNEDTSVGPIGVTVGDAQTPAGDLTVTAVSSNQTLLPNGNITLGGSGANRTVSLMPAADQFGTTTITLTVSDGSLTASDSFTLTVNSVDDPPVLSVSGSVTYTENDPSLSVAPGLTVTDIDGGTIDGARVIIQGGFNAAQDRLGILGQTGTSGTVNGLSWTYNTGSGVLSLSGSGSATAYQDALRLVSYENLSEAPSNAPRSITFSLGNNSLYFADTGHFYEFVPGKINWDVARARAEAIGSYGQSGYPSGVFGLQGYLVTITSQAENDFAASKLQGDGWIGAADLDQEGTWKWVTGPEAGLIFSFQFKTGSCSANTAPGVNGQYANWGNGEPNDCGNNEDVAHFISSNGKWNDYPVTHGPYVAGYVVEYGGMPGDSVPQISGTATVNVVPVNDAPTITALSDQTILEGGPTVTLGFTIADVDNLVSSLTVTVTNSDPSTVSAVLGGSGSNRTIALTGTDDAVASISVMVSDGQLSATTIFSLTVQNVAPVANAGAGGTIDEGSTFSGSGSFTDPGADTWTATVDYGDGSGTQPLALSGKSFSLSHLYADDGNYTVTVTVTDDDGGVGTDTATVSVNNVAPSVNAGADGTIDEGSTFSGSGTFADPGADTWTATVDYGDGSGTQPLALSGKNFNLSHVYADNGDYTVTVTVTDDDGGIGTDTLVVTVNNVPPSVDAGADGTIDEGSTFSGSGSFTDPGADTWTATVDYGDGSGTKPLALSGKNFSLSHLYADDGAYTVTVTVTDDDGGVGSDTLGVTVNNVAPVVNAGADSTLISSQTLQVQATFSDPGVLDTHTAMVDWGDGSPVQSATVTETNGSGTVTAARQYFVPGTYTVTVCVTDKDEATTCESLTLTVKRLQVKIDIKPGNGTGPNPINLREKGSTPVGVLTGTYDGIYLDATQIKADSVVFEGAPNQQIGKGPTDLDADGDLDQVFHFETAQTTLTSTSTSGTLTGISESGVYFEGSDQIRIIGR